MTLRKIGDRWAGDDLDDLVGYFAAEPEEAPVHQVVVAGCAECGGRVFTVELDESSTCVRRACVGCAAVVDMLDSGVWWPTLEAEAEARYFVECTCGEDEFEVAVGFEFYEDTPVADVRWVSVAVRCTADGLIGCCANWKIREGDSRHLVDAV